MPGARACQLAGPHFEDRCRRRLVIAFAPLHRMTGVNWTERYPWRARRAADRCRRSMRQRPMRVVLPIDAIAARYPAGSTTSTSPLGSSFLAGLFGGSMYVPTRIFLYPMSGGSFWGLPGRDVPFRQSPSLVRPMRVAASRGVRPLCANDPQPVNVGFTVVAQRCARTEYHGDTQCRSALLVFKHSSQPRALGVTS